MNALTLLKNLEQHGVFVTLDGSELEVRGPREAMTEPRLAALRDLKPEILALLNQRLQDEAEAQSRSRSCYCADVYDVNEARRYALIQTDHTVRLNLMSYADHVEERRDLKTRCDETQLALARACYALCSQLKHCLSMRQANARKCRPATVSGSRS